MPYNPATDFVGLWRNNGGDVSKASMPGLDYVVAALARAGLVSLAVSATPPVSNQNVTAWLQAAVPSYSAEGVLHLWDAGASAYVPATPRLFLRLLQASAGQSGVSWWSSVGGSPNNTVGNDGDYAIRLDGVGGIYGPKTAGAWPLNPIPGSTNTIDQAALDNTFGNEVGSLIVRGVAGWDAIAPGAPHRVFSGTGVVPGYVSLTSLFDDVFSSIRGSILYRGVSEWRPLPPSSSGMVLSTNGPNADPAWAPRTAEFPSGTRVVFHQTSAPPGWTKDTSINDYGLRVVSGAAGTVAGSAFSAVFAQTAVGNTTLTEAQMPAHQHGYNEGAQVFYVNGSSIAAALQYNTPAATSAAGGSEAHTHSVNLALAYTDVIIAVKD